MAALEAFLLLQDYARKHALTFLLPAFFITGAIAVFVSGDAVIRYLAPQMWEWLSYSVASLPGSILAVR